MAAGATFFQHPAYACELCGATSIKSEITCDSPSPAVYTAEQMRAYARAALDAAPVEAKPIDMVLHCPNCGVQHIDAPEPGHLDTGAYPAGGVVGWTNPPHRSHLCHGCGYVWRPADVPTNGVAGIQTKGEADSPLASTPTLPPDQSPVAQSPRALKEGGAADQDAQDAPEERPATNRCREQHEPSSSAGGYAQARGLATSPGDHSTLPPSQAKSEPSLIVSDEMVTAYLKANDDYWQRTDELPTPPNQWRTGNVREATRVSLQAALAEARIRQYGPEGNLEEYVPVAPGAKPPQSTEAKDAARGCPHCHMPALGWSDRDLIKGWRDVPAGREYHCREAAVND